MFLSCRGLLRSGVPAAASLQASWSEQRQRPRGRESVNPVWSGDAAWKTKIRMDENGLLEIPRLSVGVSPTAGMPRPLFVVTKAGEAGCSP